MVPHPVFLTSGLSLRFGDVDVFFLQSKVLCSSTHSLSSEPNFQTDTVVPSSDHCRTEAVLPPSDHYCIETVAPSGAHYCIDIVVPSSGHCCTETVPPCSDHHGTTKVVPQSDYFTYTRNKRNNVNSLEKKTFTKSLGAWPRGPLWLPHWGKVG